MASDQFVCQWKFLSRSSIASVFLLDIILPREDSDPIKHEIVAVSTTGNNERVQKWLAEHKVPNMSSVKVYNSWEKMLQKGDFDVIYISTSLHITLSTINMYSRPLRINEMCLSRSQRP
jgi:dihydrodiol dehydrogenase / D-xylose 1-dehydrogenase (NADP)